MEKENISINKKDFKLLKQYLNEMDNTNMLMQEQIATLFIWIERIENQNKKKGLKINKLKE